MVNRLYRKDEDSKDVDVSNLDPVELIGWKGPKPQKKLLGREEIIRRLGLDESTVKMLEFINSDSRFKADNVAKDFIDGI